MQNHGVVICYECKFYKPLSYDKYAYMAMQNKKGIKKDLVIRYIYKRMGMIFIFLWSFMEFYGVLWVYCVWFGLV
jgi:hypothetical protein